jgi:class 3 adenylate cyclase/CHASE2 domain-containing sensor protein
LSLAGRGTNRSSARTLRARLALALLPFMKIPRQWLARRVELLCVAGFLFFLSVDSLVPALLDTPRDLLLAYQVKRLVRKQADPQILIAGIDEESRQAGAFTRANHARVIHNLSKAGARVIFYDVEFDEPRDPAVDKELAQAVELSNRCVLAAAYQTNSEGFRRPRLIPDFDRALEEGRASLGLINIDRTAEMQKALLSVQADGHIELSAAAAILARMNHLRNADVVAHGDTLYLHPFKIPVQTLNEMTGGIQLELTRVTTIYNLPATGPEGKAGPGRYRLVSYRRLLDPNDPIFASVSGSIVMIGDNTKTDTDLFQTPVGEMKGVEIHAQILDTLLNGPWLASSRPGTPLFWLDAGLQIVICSILASLIWRQPSVPRMLAMQSAMTAITVAFYWEMSAYAIVLNLPLLVINLSQTFLICGLLRVSANSQLLRRFIPQEIAAQLLAKGQSEVTQCRATVIVTDIRGYTSLSETKTPRQILTMLNEYHTETVNIFENHGGSVLNYQGDAQIVLFGYPKRLKDPARAAVMAALQTSQAIDRLRQRWGLKEDQTFDVGAGVCTGQVSIGELGGEAMQAEFTVIGKTVRRCHKAQSLSKQLHSKVLVDEDTMLACRVRPDLQELGFIELDGSATPVKLFGLRSPS